MFGAGATDNATARSTRQGRVAAGGYPPAAPTDPDVPHSRIRLLDLRLRCNAHIAVLRRCLLMVFWPDVPAIYPSASSTAREAASLHRVSWGRFPGFAGTLRRLRPPLSRGQASPPLPPRFVPFARQSPRLRPLRSPRAGRFLVRRPRHFFWRGEDETSQIPGLLGSPTGHWPAIAQSRGDIHPLLYAHTRDRRARLVRGFPTRHSRNQMPVANLGARAPRPRTKIRKWLKRLRGKSILEKSLHTLLHTECFRYSQGHFSRSSSREGQFPALPNTPPNSARPGRV